MSKIASSKYKHAVPKSNRPEWYTDLTVNTETSETSQVVKASRKFIAFPYGSSGQKTTFFLGNYSILSSSSSSSSLSFLLLLLFFFFFSSSSLSFFLSSFFSSSLSFIPFCPSCLTFPSLLSPHCSRGSQCSLDSCGSCGAGGGSVGVLALSETGGKFAKDLPLVSGHSAPISDLDFSPFDDHLLATGSDDTTARLTFFIII